MPARRAAEATEDGLRLDRWLWHARFFKTRALAAQIAGRRKVRINTVIVTKPHYRVRPGDVLTFPQGRVIRVVRVVAIGERRGPATEARTLYEDLAAPDASHPTPAARSGESDLTAASRSRKNPADRKIWEDTW